MPKRLTVKVGRHNQITLPSHIRQELNIQVGDQLLVDVQDRMIILLPQPRDFVTYLEGLHKEIWEGLDVEAYLREERNAW